MNKDVITSYSIHYTKLYDYNNISIDVVDSKSHKDLAYEAAVKSCVLLENKNNVLPLDKSMNYLYITGPNANNADSYNFV